MRVAIAAYSSAVPGRKRERNTVIIMAVCTSVLLFASGHGGDVLLRNGSEPGDPGPRRAKPDLLLRHKPSALAQNSDTQRVGGPRMFARRGRIDRRGARRAEGLNSRIAAVRRGLQIACRLPCHREGIAGGTDRDAKRRTGAGLTVGAMADRNRLRIDLRRNGNCAAMAGAVHLYGFAPCAWSADRSMFSMSASDSPK
jgi:hypothetical protein